MSSGKHKVGGGIAVGFGTSNPIGAKMLYEIRSGLEAKSFELFLPPRRWMLCAVVFVTVYTVGTTVHATQHNATVLHVRVQIEKKCIEPTLRDVL
jgi:hypothetical protein